MSCSGTPGMGGPLAEGARSVPVGYVVPADCGKQSGARSFEGDAGPHRAAGNVAQFPGRNANGSDGSGELEALLNQLQYVSNGPGPPLLEVLSGMNLEDDGWFPVLQHLASSTGNEAYGHASTPGMVGAHSQSDDNSGQLVNGISGMCTPHPEAYQCGLGNLVGNRGSTGMLALIASVIPAMPHAPS